MTVVHDLENLELATGGTGTRDFAKLLPAKVAKDINKYVAEQAWGRKLFRVNRDLVGAVGLTIHYPLKERAIAGKLADMGEVLVGMGEWKEKTSTTAVIGARAQWTYAAEEARMFDLMATELEGALDAIAEYENKMVYDACVGGVAPDNVVPANTSGKLGFLDLIAMRKLVKGPMDYVVIHPNQMADVLAEDKLIHVDYITSIEQVEPSTTRFKTKLGWTFLETEQATDGVVIGLNTHRAGKFTVKKDITQLPFDAARSGSGLMHKGFTLWELIDAVVVGPDSIARCNVTA